MALLLLDNDWSTGTAVGDGTHLSASVSRTCSQKGTLTYTASGTPTPGYSQANTPGLWLNFPDQNGQQANLSFIQAPAVGDGFRLKLGVARNSPTVVITCDGSTKTLFALYCYRENNSSLFFAALAGTVPNTGSIYVRLQVPPQFDPADTSSLPSVTPFEVTCYIRDNLGGGNYLVELWVGCATFGIWPTCLAKTQVALSAGAWNIQFLDNSKA